MKVLNLVCGVFSPTADSGRGTRHLARFPTIANCFHAIVRFTVDRAEHLDESAPVGMKTSATKTVIGSWSALQDDDRFLSSSLFLTSSNPINFQAQRFMQIFFINISINKFTKEILNDNNYHFNIDKSKQEKSTTTTNNASSQTNTQDLSVHHHASASTQFVSSSRPGKLHRQRRFNHEKRGRRRYEPSKLKHGRRRNRNRPGERSHGNAHRTRQLHPSNPTGSTITSSHLERSFQSRRSEKSSRFHGRTYPRNDRHPQEPLRFDSHRSSPVPNRFSHDSHRNTKINSAHSQHGR